MLVSHANSLQYISKFNLCLDVKTNIISGNVLKNQLRLHDSVMHFEHVSDVESFQKCIGDAFLKKNLI